ncbi:MAG: aminoacyl-tRNA hydrolase [Oscillospiraceae bacterium]|jgi:PTH1 family peptidyl-tRNA hydrolase|nr:aminoacyl-tRNA hydrolase [Oscillospiraceae bacterium]
MFFFNDKNLSFIIVGLGNPGVSYKNTRHNVGFCAIDYIAEQENLKIKTPKFNSLCQQINIEGKKVLFMKPQIFMNLSGKAVFEALKFYKISPRQLIVLLDDVNFEVGKIRIKKSGGDAGHNGMRSIIEFLNCDRFARIKIGVGSKPKYFSDLANWVLSEFSEDEKKILNDVYKECYSSFKLLLSSLNG